VPGRKGRKRSRILISGNPANVSFLSTFMFLHRLFTALPEMPAGDSTGVAGAISSGVGGDTSGSAYESLGASLGVHNAGENARD
jgi:hypothetical protein